MTSKQSINHQLYAELVKVYKVAHPTKGHLTCDKEVSVIWQALKSGADFPTNARNEIKKWKEIQRKNTLDRFLVNFTFKCK